MFDHHLKAALVAIFVSVFCFFDNAQAISINGEEYSEVLSLNVGKSLGVWGPMGKFFTTAGSLQAARAPILSSAKYRTELHGYDFANLNTMGTFGLSQNSLPISHWRNTDRDVNSSLIELFSSTGELLLSSSLSDLGLLTSRRSHRLYGPHNPDKSLEVNGLYNVTGGALAELAIFQNNPIYISFFSHNAYDAFGDVYLKESTFKFYAKSSPPSEVPEPTTLALTGIGLLGAAIRKRRTSTMN